MWPTGYTVVIQHRSCNTHDIPIPEAFARLPPCHPTVVPLFVSPTHVLDVPIRETRSACHCLVRRALDLPQCIEHSPDFLSADRVKERRCYIGGREEKNLLHLQYVRDTSGIFGVLCWLWCRSNSSGSVRACTCSKERGTRERLISVSFSLYRRSLIQPSLSLPSIFPVLRSRASFRNLPMAKERPREVCARLASNPRFLSFNWKPAERRCYRTTLLLCTNVVCSYCEAANRVRLRQLRNVLTTKFLTPLTFLALVLSLPFFFSFIYYCCLRYTYIHLLGVQILKKFVTLSARIDFFFLWNNKFTFFPKSFLHYGGYFNFRKIFNQFYRDLSLGFINHEYNN